MKLYLIAGEASGDLHGSNLVKALLARDPSTECRAWGGDKMQAAGAHIVKHYRDLAFMGFVEVVKNLRTILGNLAFCKQDILDYQPDALVLIDYPGFNLRIAKWAHRQGIRVIYYISPQIWAWHRARVYDIQRDVDKMLVILPFEPDFYKKYGVNATFVGHPLLDAIELEAEADLLGPKTGNTIALLPGSRKQEVTRILPIMLSITPFYPEYQFVIAGASALNAEFYAPMLAAYPNVSLQFDQTYAMLRAAKAALVKSGTSTLETALIGTPQVVCYTGSPVSYAIARRIVDVKYISLVNLIMDQPLVQELIQDQFNTAQVKVALDQILTPEAAKDMRAAYAALRVVLGGGGASWRAAGEVLELG